LWKRFRRGVVPRRPQGCFGKITDGDAAPTRRTNKSFAIRPIIETKRFGSLDFDDQLEFRGSVYRQIAWLVALENQAPIVI
jgi:hypothetical protein